MEMRDREDKTEIEKDKIEEERREIGKARKKTDYLSNTLLKLPQLPKGHI